MKYALSNNGLVHGINPLQGEFTLCGDAFDIDALDDDDSRDRGWKDCESGPITCPQCAEVVEACKTMRVKKGAR